MNSDRKRVAIVVYVDLDPTPGAFNTEESALNNIRGILENVIPYYNPTTAFAPDSLQPVADDTTREVAPVVFRSRRDANSALSELEAIAEADGHATISELYAISAGATPAPAGFSRRSDHYWGWRNLKGAIVKEDPNNDHALLVLPPAEHLTHLTPHRRSSKNKGSN